MRGRRNSSWFGMRTGAFASGVAAIALAFGPSHAQTTKKELTKPADTNIFAFAWSLTMNFRACKRFTQARR